MMDLRFYKPIIVAAMLALLWILESIIPQFVARKRRLSHNAANLTLGAINAVATFGLALALYAICESAEQHGFGLMRWIAGPLAQGQTALPVWLQWILVLIVFDFWMYVWHVINHKIPLLWRLHSVHHTDEELDASSALRFHTGEILLSSTARLAVAPLLGMSIEQLLVYEIILQPVILFHHSNVRVPSHIDRILRCVIVTPWMHWVHHSEYQPETDSNYASVLSIWDRVFRTFRLRQDPDRIQLGLKGYQPRQWRRLDGMLLSPFKMPPRCLSPDTTNDTDGARPPQTDRDAADEQTDNPTSE